MGIENLRGEDNLYKTSNFLSEGTPGESDRPGSIEEPVLGGLDNSRSRGTGAKASNFGNTACIKQVTS